MEHSHNHFKMWKDLYVYFYAPNFHTPDQIKYCILLQTKLLQPMQADYNQNYLPGCPCSQYYSEYTHLHTAVVEQIITFA